jgi:hypothetical protein
LDAKTKEGAEKIDKLFNSTEKLSPHALHNERMNKLLTAMVDAGSKLK